VPSTYYFLPTPNCQLKCSAKICEFICANQRETIHRSGRSVAQSIIL